MSIEDAIDSSIPDPASHLQGARGPGRPAQPEKAEAIIAAAQRLFMERGFEKTTVDAIAEAAGVAKATVYKRFGGKEELLRTSIEAKCGKFLDAETLAFRPSRDLRQGLIEISRRFLNLVTDADAVAMHRLIMEESARNPHLPRLFYETAIVPTKEKLAAYFAAEEARGVIRLDDPSQAAWRFLSMVKGQDHLLAMFGLPPRSEAEIARHVEACADAFIAAHS